MRFIEPKTNFPRGRRSQADIIENHIWSFEMTVLWFAQKSKEWFNVAFMTHGLKAKLIIDIVYTVDNWYCYMFEALSNSKHIVFIYETHWINVHTYKQVFFSQYFSKLNVLKRMFSNVHTLAGLGKMCVITGIKHLIIYSF